MTMILVLVLERLILLLTLKLRKVSVQLLKLPNLLKRQKAQTRYEHSKTTLVRVGPKLNINPAPAEPLAITGEARLSTCDQCSLPIIGKISY